MKDINIIIERMIHAAQIETKLRKELLAVLNADEKQAIEKLARTDWIAMLKTGHVGGFLGRPMTEIETSAIAKIDKERLCKIA